jgi:hypothetical protein
MTGGINITGDAPFTHASDNAMQAGGLFMTGNFVSVLGNTLNVSPGGIQVTGTEARISDNTVYQGTVHGIVAGGQSKLRDNKLIDCNTTDDSLGSGIYLQGDQCQMFGNVVENRTSIGKIRYGVYARATTGHQFRDNRYVGMQAEDVHSTTPNPPVVPRSQELVADHALTPAGAGVTEDTLKSAMFGAGSLGPAGGVRIRAGGHGTGVGGTKTIRLYFGATAVAALNVPAGVATWLLDATVFDGNGEAFQVWEYRAYINGALSVESGLGTSTENTTTSPVVVRVTGQKAIAGDDLDCQLFQVERFQ